MVHFLHSASLSRVAKRRGFAAGSLINLEITLTPIFLSTIASPLEPFSFCFNLSHKSMGVSAVQSPESLKFRRMQDVHGAKVLGGVVHFGELDVILSQLDRRQ